MDDGFGRGVDGGPLANPVEERLYRRFSEASYARADGTGGRGLFRFLMRPRTSDPAAQVYAPFNKDSNDRSLAMRPNFNYTAAMLRANADRVGIRMASASTLDRRYAALALLLGCPVPNSVTRAVASEGRAIHNRNTELGRATYRRYVESETEPPAACTTACNPVPCRQLHGPPPRISDKQVGSFCPDLVASSDPEPATLISAARGLGMSNNEISDLFPSEADVAGDANYQAYILSGSSGNVGRMALSASLLRRLSTTEPELAGYISSDPANPTCSEPPPVNPVLQSRCVIPETCQLPSLTATPRPGEPNLCAKLAQLQRAAAPGSSGGGSSGSATKRADH
jgi:hypothetical protein